MFSKGELKVVNFGSCSGKENKPNEGQKNENMLFSNPWIQRWMSSKDHRLRNQDSGLSGILALYPELLFAFMFIKDFPSEFRIYNFLRRELLLSLDQLFAFMFSI